MANRNFKNHAIFIILVENNFSVKKNIYHEIAAHIALRKKILSLKSPKVEKQS